MTTATHNYGWLMPDPGGSANTWGNVLNGATQAIDGVVWSITNAPVTFNAAVTCAGSLTVNGQATVAGGLNCNYVGIATTLSVAGATTLYGTLNVNGAATLSSATFGGLVTANAGLNASGVPANFGAGLNVGTAFNVVSGASTFGPITVSGVATFNAPLVAPAGLLVKSGDNSIIANVGGQYVQINGSTGFGAGSSFILNGGARSYAFEWYWGSAGIAQMGGDGSIYIAGTVGQKLSGTTWSNPSDARIKNVIGDYTAGLAEVLQLNPVTFTFKDNYAAEAGATSPHAALAKDQTPCAGFVAQEVEAIFPEMVTQSDAYIDGRKVADFRSLDTSNLILALVNSVKELKAEIEALKASR